MRNLSERLELLTVNKSETEKTGLIVCENMNK